MTGSASKTSIALIIILALSLLMNALALGAGLRLYHMRQTLLGDSAATALPRDLRRDLGQALSQHAADLAPLLKSVQDARRDAVLALTTNPYDATKAMAALDKLRLAMDDLMAAAQTVVLARLSDRARP